MYKFVLFYEIVLTTHIQSICVTERKTFHLHYNHILRQWRSTIMPWYIFVFFVSYSCWFYEKIQCSQKMLIPWLPSLSLLGLMGHQQLCMMTSSNGNIFRVTGHLCGEFIGQRWILRTKASDAELRCFLWSAMKKRLSKQWWGWWFQTPPCPLWRQSNGYWRWKIDKPLCENRLQVPC